MTILRRLRRRVEVRRSGAHCWPLAGAQGGGDGVRLAARAAARAAALRIILRASAREQVRVHFFCLHILFVAHSFVCSILLFSLLRRLFRFRIILLHANRKLRWVHALATCVLLARFKNKSKALATCVPSSSSSSVSRHARAACAPRRTCARALGQRATVPPACALTLAVARDIVFASCRRFVFLTDPRPETARPYRQLRTRSLRAPSRCAADVERS